MQRDISPTPYVWREPQSIPPRRRININAVCDICGGVSSMTIWRWLKDDRMGFPKPVYVGRRRYWVEQEVIDWLNNRDEAPPEFPPPHQSLPTFYCRTVDDSFVFFCSKCGAKHRHTATEGHRVSGACDCWPAGYYIKS